MKKLIAILFSALLLALSAFSGYAQGQQLSPAIEVIRENITLEKSGITGSAVTFSARDFENAVGSEVDYVVISSLPDKAAGKLTVFGEDVVTGQTVPVSNLSYLTFTPAGKQIASTTFSFRAGAEGWKDKDISCVVTFNENLNVSPIASNEKIETLTNIPVYHTLAVGDADGDSITVNIQSYPKNGYLTVSADGKIKYTPKGGYNGKDSFSYTASDKYGSVSEIATVSIQVDRNKYGLVFADMADSDAYACAVKMSQDEIMTYSLKDGEYFFSPTEKVKKIDYLVMLITAVGMEKDAIACEDTLFEDDDVLTPTAKGYLALALREGIVEIGDGEFAPTAYITRGEAEQMTVNALQAAGYGGIISSGENASDELTKADVAKILNKVSK